MSQRMPQPRFNSRRPLSELWSLACMWAVPPGMLQPCKCWGLDQQADTGSAIQASDRCRALWHPHPTASMLRTSTYCGRELAWDAGLLPACMRVYLQQGHALAGSARFGAALRATGARRVCSSGRQLQIACLPLRVPHTRDVHHVTSHSLLSVQGMALLAYCFRRRHCLQCHVIAHVVSRYLMSSYTLPVGIVCAARQHSAAASREP